MEDIPLLAKHFVELSAKDLKCAKPRLTRAASRKAPELRVAGQYP
jgi:DNA-binding NtrC family response regulator